MAGELERRGGGVEGRRRKTERDTNLKATAASELPAIAMGIGGRRIERANPNNTRALCAEFLEGVPPARPPARLPPIQEDPTARSQEQKAEGGRRELQRKREPGGVEKILKNSALSNGMA